MSSHGQNPSRSRDVDGKNLSNAAWPARHHHDTVPQHNRFIDAVSDKDHRLAFAFQDAQQLFLHQLSGLGIERTEGFVHEQHRGVDRHGASQTGALLHPAGKLVGI